MFCRQCGTANDDNAYRCVKCSDILQTPPPPPPPPITPTKYVNNNLILAIVVTVLCCLPLGIVGIVHAAQVNGKLAAGDIAGAEESARKARLWSFWGMGVAVVGFTVYSVLALMFGLAGMFNQ